MKEYRLIYVPIGREDKEWTIIEAKDQERALIQATPMGDIVSLEDITQ
tara:strand:- start:249 stop:392 length:144 start_codon:yes stop_codon:yes gene_type:complete